MTLPGQNTEVVIPRGHKTFCLVVHNDGGVERLVCVCFESPGERLLLKLPDKMLIFIHIVTMFSHEQIFILQRKCFSNM